MDLRLCMTTPGKRMLLIQVLKFVEKKKQIIDMTQNVTSIKVILNGNFLASRNIWMLKKVVHDKAPNWLMCSFVFVGVFFRVPFFFPYSE